jgi:hypothetical protein
VVICPWGASASCCQRYATYEIASGPGLLATTDPVFVARVEPKVSLYIQCSLGMDPAPPYGAPVMNGMAWEPGYTVIVSIPRRVFHGTSLKRMGLDVASSLQHKILTE